MLKYFLALFLLVVIYNQVVESSKCDCSKKICPKGWLLRRGRCYRLFRRPLPWKGAFFNCWRKGGYLVQISNRREFLVVIKFARSFWIDGKRACYKNKRSFTYAMATRRFQRPYTRFIIGEPNNRRGVENCLQVYAQAMKDTNCRKKLRYVCEKAPKVRKQ